MYRSARGAVHHIATRCRIPFFPNRAKPNLPSQIDDDIQAMVPDFFVPASMVAQQVQLRALHDPHTQPAPPSAGTNPFLLFSHSPAQRWLEWSADGQLVRRRRAPHALRSTATTITHAEHQRDDAWYGAQQHHAQNTPYLFTMSSGKTCAGRDFSALHDSIELAASTIPTFPVPVTAVRAVLETWWRVEDLSASTAADMHASVARHRDRAELRCRFPTATALLDHPQLQFVLHFSSLAGDAMEGSGPTHVQLHRRFSHTKRGTADALYAGLGLPSFEMPAMTVLDDLTAASALPSPSPYPCAVARVETVANIATLLARLLDTPRGVSQASRPGPTRCAEPVAMWSDSPDCAHVVVWGGHVDRDQLLLHCKLTLPFSALRGYHISQEDSVALASAVNRLVIITPSLASSAILSLQLQSACPSLCRSDLGALAESTGVPLGELWHTATPQWQALHLARVVGVAALLTIEIQTAPRLCGAAEMLEWGGVAVEVARRLVQRDAQVTTELTRLTTSATPHVSLAARLASPRGARLLTGTDRRLLWLIGDIQRLSMMAKDVRCSSVLSHYSDTLARMSGGEKDRLLQRLVALWGPESFHPWPQAQGQPASPHVSSSVARPERLVHGGAIPRPLAPTPDVRKGNADTTAAENKDAPQPLPGAAELTEPMTTEQPRSHFSPTTPSCDGDDCSLTVAPIDADFLTQAMTPSTSPTAVAEASRGMRAATTRPYTADKLAASPDAHLPPSFLGEMCPDTTQRTHRTGVHRSENRSLFRGEPKRRRVQSSRSHTRLDMPAHEGTLALSTVSDLNVPLESIESHEIAADILGSASSHSQRRLHPWQ